MIIKNKYCTVKHTSGDVHVSDYLTNARVETSQTMNVYDNIDSVPASDVLPMPDEGEPVEENKLYKFNDKVYHVIQSHTRTYYDPDETPALFAVHRTDTGDLNWIENEKVNTGDIRIHNDVKYECIQGHMTTKGWEPDKTPSLWNVVSDSEEWTIGVAYTVDDIVTYNGNTYKCLQSHTSQAGWNPEATPALWEIQS